MAASVSQGNCFENSGMVVCDLGNLAGATSATIVLVVIPTDYGSFTNVATMTRNEFDPVSANNTATHVTRVVGVTASHGNGAPGSISIPDAGMTAPYPSTLLVSGIAAPVVKVTATLSNLTHSYPDDLDVLVVGPGGQKAMLMSDVGGDVGIHNVTLTFDDGAAATLQDSGEITSGTFRPSDYATGDALPAPAPAGPFGTAMSVFNTVDPNGSWRLFVYDDSAGDSGSIANGWSLQVTTRQAPDPVILNPGFNGEWFQFHFLALAGQDYFVEYKDALDETEWQALQWVTGDGTVQWITDYSTGLTQRFFRLRVE